MPEPGGRINGDLARLDAMEAGERAKAEEKCEYAEGEVRGVETGDEVKK